MNNALKHKEKALYLLIVVVRSLSFPSLSPLIPAVSVFFKDLWLESGTM